MQKELGRNMFVMLDRDVNTGERFYEGNIHLARVGKQNNHCLGLMTCLNWLYRSLSSNTATRFTLEIIENNWRFFNYATFKLGTTGYPTKSPLVAFNDIEYNYRCSFYAFPPPEISWAMRDFTIGRQNWSHSKIRPLFRIFNDCIQLGSIPTDWKRA